MVVSLLYVSRSTLELPRQSAEVERIVAQSLGRNPDLDITGALIFTEEHFAQNIEGSAASIDILMASIMRDPRHCDVQIVYRETLPARRFEAWTMAYGGPSTFVAGNVLPLTDPLAAPAQRKASERLITLMRQFAEANLIAQRRAR